MKGVTNIFLEQHDMHFHENEWFASIDQALHGVVAAEAAWTSSGISNSIWQIVNHLIFWNEDVIHRINGTENPQKAEENETTFGNPGNPEDEIEWARTVQRLNEVMNELKTVIADLDDEKLKAPYAADRYSIERLLSNIMMHDTYHLGQIVLLRKLQSSWGGVDWS
ncbi:MULTISPECIES: DinB family protein [unclassified Mesobacillus]|uniref:DinB family protein n=1 Tax=unclassified Mesobacillus TaxID=2675270 RepID=UPI00203E8D52|nr:MULTISPECIES: DinB family protein [unclassified Mesobacillus]MCM3122926.1 DinB family protein [Mesobacillus sp. MER 33]MCM3233591.1 DinB family protein [Mesobacillus sp. MER 48]